MKKLVTLLLAVAMVIGMVSGLAEGEMEGNMYLEGLPIVKEPVVYDIVANIQGHDVDPATVPHTLALNEATGENGRKAPAGPAPPELPRIIAPARKGPRKRSASAP